MRHFADIAQEWTQGGGPYLQALHQQSQSRHIPFKTWLTLKHQLFEDYQPKRLADFACLFSF